MPTLCCFPGSNKHLKQGNSIPIYIYFFFVELGNVLLREEWWDCRKLTDTTTDAQNISECELSPMRRQVATFRLPAQGKLATWTLENLTWLRPLHPRLSYCRHMFLTWPIFSIPPLPFPLLSPFISLNRVLTA